MNRTEARTAEILRPSGFISLHSVKRLFNLTKKVFSRPTKNKLTVDKPEVVHRDSFALLKKIGPALAKPLIVLAHIGQSSWKLVRHKEARQGFWSGLLTFHKRLKLQHYMALGLFLVALAVIYVNINTLQNKQLAKQQTENFSTISKNIEAKYSDLESTRLYGNRDMQKTYLNEIGILIGTLPSSTPDQQQQIAEATKRYQNALDQIYNISHLKPDSLLPNTGGLSAVWARGTALYGLSGISLQQISNLSSSSTIADIGASICQPLPAPETANVLYCLAGNNVITLDLTKKLATPKPITNIPGNVIGGGFYNGRLYLATANQEIYRFGGGQNSWSGRSSWLASAGSIITNVAIDGNIYLAGGAQVFKYKMGKLQDYSLEQVNPALTSISALITNNNSDFIIIADNSNKRILSFDKLGKLVKQYTSDNPLNVKQLELDEDGKTLYALTDLGVYKLSLK
jgi:hypothetical protein